MSDIKQQFLSEMNVSFIIIQLNDPNDEEPAFVGDSDGALVTDLWNLIQLNWNNIFWDFSEPDEEHNLDSDPIPSLEFSETEDIVVNERNDSSLILIILLCVDGKSCDIVEQVFDQPASQSVDAFLLFMFCGSLPEILLLCGGH